MMSYMKYLLGFFLGFYVLIGSAKDDVVVTQGHATLTFDDIDARILEIPQAERAGFMVPKRIESTLGQLLLIEQLAQDARELGLDKTHEYALKQKLEEKRMLASMMQQYVYDHAPEINAKALAKETYMANPKRFITREQATIRHIMFKLDCRSDEAAKKLAEDTLSALNKDKTPFEDIAKRVSEDTETSVDGGLLKKSISHSAHPDDFEKAVFMLKEPGDISNVVKTPTGYHIIQLVKLESGGKPLTYEEVEESLIAELEQQNKDKVVREHNEKLMNNKMDADPDKVYSLRSRYKDGVIPGVKE